LIIGHGGKVSPVVQGPVGPQPECNAGARLVAHRQRVGVEVRSLVAAHEHELASGGLELLVEAAAMMGRGDNQVPRSRSASEARQAERATGNDAQLGAAASDESRTKSRPELRPGVCQAGSTRQAPTMTSVAGTPKDLALEAEARDEATVAAAPSNRLIPGSRLIRSRTMRREDSWHHHGRMPGGTPAP